ncbi:MAG: FxDxF family PEP-CTERM protein [Pseudomonadota bacterium]
MNIKCLITAIALSGFSLAGSATDLGPLTAQPKIQDLTISAPDVTFSTQYLFSLANDAKVSAGATDLSLMLTGITFLGISDFSLKLFNSANGLLATAGVTDHTFRIDDVVLPASNYYFQVSGTTTGVSGGHYSFATVALPSTLPGGETPNVPEPASMGLFAVGLAAIGLMRLRSTRRDHATGNAS